MRQTPPAAPALLFAELSKEFEKAACALLLGSTAVCVLFLSSASARETIPTKLIYNILFEIRRIPHTRTAAAGGALSSPPRKKRSADEETGKKEDGRPIRARPRPRRARTRRFIIPPRTFRRPLFSFLFLRRQGARRRRAPAALAAFRRWRNLLQFYYAERSRVSVVRHRSGPF
ncbi:hypothetical protein EVAR_21422_1 [Eumeta japonica]|uniref:Uncharacterized protein n=1 Tax=Eumeta variegata TaxID=151549 RepID=A0A4C1VHV5_EUMVA|nr:hypothetical protein EVAR_21422_1 [Eumeta japonica]